MLFASRPAVALTAADQPRVCRYRLPLIAVTVSLICVLTFHDVLLVSHSAVTTVICPLRLRLDADPRSLDVCSRLLLRAVAVDCLPAALLLRRTQLTAVVLLSFLLLSESTALPRLHRLQSLAVAVVAFARPLVPLLRCFRAVCFNLFWTVVLADAFAC